ncbi:aspartate aminotransferase family protein [Campylobacter mucosalis]|uniref:N-succinyldiaminopimelate-aminotransferase / acetylornithine transaminase n=1 Tax=Campylobacter mucosalis CCUG 21559 TaxID=1032067 RepID=A0A6G5QH39_9BACT|nr:aspartate aminotransferase family protein [Campylobacter mucosalis]QCD45005.1 N-succinyldiaminopimelate-aminotransferase / acetylornithine transaminase [Campylobacter mucosalis CCUG 21559]
MYLMNNYARFDVGFERGEGATLFDKNGKDYIDFAAGIGVNALGYANKSVTKAICKQAKKLLHTSNIYHIKPQEKLAKEISKQLGYHTYAFFCNSGAEANECAIKLARKYGTTHFSKKKFEIISLGNSFHGRTLATLRATGQDKFHPEIFAPYTQGFKFCSSIDEVIASISDETVAVMIELVQGEGGIKAFDKDEIKRLSKELKKRELLLITDEVQCGVYRTGEFVTSKIYDIKPDIITFAKGLGGGVPIGACVSRKDIFTSGDHGSTFGGNFLACASGLATLKELKKLKKSGELKKIAKNFDSELDGLLSSYPKIFSSKQGIGMMLGLVLKDESNLVKIIQSSLKNGVLVLRSGKDTLRFLPPLNISKQEIKEGFARLKKAINEI